jgi:transcriptional regulator with XRE-family HTH domain
MYSSPRHDCQGVFDVNATIKLLDKYREVCSLNSDNAAAVKLGISRSAVSLWRGGKGHPEADSIEKMCEATGENIARWMPLIESERARSPGARKAWLRLAQLAAGVAAIYLFSRLDVQTHDGISLAFLYIMRN